MSIVDKLRKKNKSLASMLYQARAKFKKLKAENEQLKAELEKRDSKSTELRNNLLDFLKVY